MLDRVIKSKGLSMRLTYIPNYNLYKGRILNYSIITLNDKSSSVNNIIYGDTANEVIERFSEIANNISVED